jgi:hypothetical protein
MERPSESARTKLENPTEARDLPQAQHRRGTRPVLSSWERKKLFLVGDSSDPLEEGSSTYSEDSRSDSGFATDADGETGCQSPESDRRESLRYQVDEMKIVLAWSESAEILSPSHELPTAHRTTGHYGEEADFLWWYRSRGASLPNVGAGYGVAETGFDLVHASILNMSQFGLCLLVDSLPPGDCKLWVGMVGAESCEWAQVSVCSLSEPQPGRYRLGFTFAHGCPYSMFRIAVLKSRAR